MYYETVAPDVRKLRPSMAKQHRYNIPEQWESISLYIVCKEIVKINYKYLQHSDQIYHHLSTCFVLFIVNYLGVVSYSLEIF